MFSYSNGPKWKVVFAAAATPDRQQRKRNEKT
jgi:hypothetical protein